MEAIILDASGEVVNFIDTFKSFIWTDRFDECGDFELYLPAASPAMSSIEREMRVQIDGSDREMIIEEIVIESDEENIPFATLRGRSLESILERRVIWRPTVLKGSFQDSIHKLIDENIISPLDPKRKISGFTFLNSEDARIKNITIDCQLECDNLYSTIVSLCKEKGVGFRVLPNDTGGFIFNLYAGEDRSYGQEANPYVVFSPEFDNLISSSYLDSSMDERNVALIKGQNKDETDMYIEVGFSGALPEGLDRREIFTDGSGVSRTIYSEGEQIEVPEDEYLGQLRYTGIKELVEHAHVEMFDSEIDGTRQFIYREDYNIGDIVQVINEFGYESQSMVVEYIRSHDENGVSEYPTFATVI